MDEVKFRCLGFVLETSNSVKNTGACTCWHSPELECAERESKNTAVLQACRHVTSHTCGHGHVT